MFFLGKIHLGPVVLRADSDIQWINCYSADNCLPIYPVDSIIHTLNNPGLIHRVKSIFCLFIVGMSVIIPVSQLIGTHFKQGRARLELLTMCFMWIICCSMLNKALVKNSNCWDLAIYKNSWEVKIDTAKWKNRYQHNF